VYPGQKILHVDAEVDGSIGQGAERKCFQMRCLHLSCY
jgi:hypothetical protein